MADDDKNPAENASRPSPSGDDERSAFDVIGDYLRPGRENVILVYILYLAGLVPAFGGIPIFVGFVLALLNRGEVGEDLASHYEFQVRQAIVGFVAALISAVLAFILIGIVGFVLIAIWWVVRSVKGLQAVTRGDPIEDPKTYSW